MSARDAQSQTTAADSAERRRIQRFLALCRGEPWFWVVIDGERIPLHDISIEGFAIAADAPLPAGAAFDFDRLRAAAGSIPSVDHFDRLAVRRLIEDLMGEQRTLTRAVARASDPSVGVSEEAAEASVDAWIGARQGVVEGVRASVDEIEGSGSGWTFAKLTIANATIRDLAVSAAQQG